MKRIYFALLILAALAFSVIAQEAVFSEVNGKVEFQASGASWKPAKVGDKVKQGAMISTGFKSTAVLKIGKTSISLKPITRLSLDELIKTEGGTQTQLYLLAGRVHADVPPQAGQTTEFNVTSPTATASVRGTAFLFDGSNLLVDRGTVLLKTPTSQFRLVSKGEFSYVVKGSASVAPPTAVVVEETATSEGGGSDQSSGENASSGSEGNGNEGAGAAGDGAGGVGGNGDQGGNGPPPAAVVSQPSKGPVGVGGAMLERVHEIVVQAAVAHIAQRLEQQVYQISLSQTVRRTY